MSHTISHKKDVADDIQVQDDSRQNLPSEKRHTHNTTKPNIHLTKKDVTIFTYLAVALASFLMRIIHINYSDNGYPVFDEKHYVSQAHQMIFNNFIENNPGYGLVVHPPTGKFLISLGIELFGYTPLGWRFTSIIAGIIVVLCTMFIAHKITGSLSIGIITAILINIEGVTFIMSRVGMLDSFLAACIAMITVCLLMEFSEDRSNVPFYQHWWLLAAGILCGITMSIKISGVYYAAFAGIFMVAFYAIKTRSVRKTLNSFGTGLIFFFIIPVSIFFMSYTKWFTNENSVYRHAIESSMDTSDFPEFPSHLPLTLQNFLYYQLGVLEFHSGLKSDPATYHPWESNSWQWAIAERPMLFYSNNHGANGTENIWLLGNLPLWWMFIPVIVFSIVRLCMKDLKWIIVLGGFITGYLPWLIMHERQSYFFYVTPLAMFLILGIVFAIYDISQYIASQKNKDTENVFIAIFGAVVIIALIFFIIYTPWYYGISMPESYHNTMTLFDNWEPLEKTTVPETTAPDN